MGGIERGNQIAGGRFQAGAVQITAFGLLFGLGAHGVEQAGGAFDHFLPIAAPGQVQALEQVLDAGAAHAGFLGQVGGGEKGLSVRGQDHVERPATPAGHGLAKGHIEHVEVRAFLAVHLDGHHDGAHERGHVLVLEGLALHDVAPVAGGVADGQEDGFVFGPGLGKGFLTPGIPVHGVVGVLEEIGTFFVDETVRFAVHGGLPGGLLPWEAGFATP